MAYRFEVSSLSSAELKVFELIQKGENYRNIAKAEFVINGEIKRFNPSQISQIKAKLESKSTTNNHDPEKARVFRLFKKGKTPTDVLIETKLSYEFVNKAHSEFVKFENYVTIPKWFDDYINGLSLEVDDCNNLNGVYRCIKKAVESHIELQDHYFFAVIAVIQFQ